MSYKLVCVDMDGTLLDDKNNISDRTLMDIREADKLGVKFVVATGRIFQSACYFGDTIGVDTPVIASNGSYVGEKDSDRAIFKEYLTKKQCMEIYNILKKYDIKPKFYTEDTIYTGDMVNYILAYKRMNERMPEKRRVNIEVIEDWHGFLNTSPTLIKAMALDEDGEKVKKAKEEFIQLDEFEVVSSFRNSFEIMVKGVSKGNGIKELCNYYKIKREEVIAMGDSENDISMIKFAGLGVAMANSDEEVKKSADYITSSNNEDGVAKVIERFILSR